MGIKKFKEDIINGEIDFDLSKCVMFYSKEEFENMFIISDGLIQGKKREFTKEELINKLKNGSLEIGVHQLPIEYMEK